MAEELPWTGTRQSTTYSKACMQSKSSFTPVGVSEDCLYLNFWLPEHSNTSEPRAVMLFFYGGSWVIGSAMFPIYDGEHLARRGVVAVAANYRLGLFGFLGSEALRASDGSTGNFGLQDQRLAMLWVRRNAAALGADASRVMIFGESAGAGSVANHLVHPRSWGLFSRAGMESGPWADWSAVALSAAELATKHIAAAVGCDHPGTTGAVADVRAAFSATAATAGLAACLRNVSEETLLSAEGSAPRLPPTMAIAWAPVIDGVELTASPRDLGAAGHFAPNVSVSAPRYRRSTMPP